MNIPMYSMGLQPAAHGYNCKLCMYYKNYTIWAVSYTTYYFSTSSPWTSPR